MQHQQTLFPLSWIYSSVLQHINNGWGVKWVGKWMLRVPPDKPQTLWIGVMRCVLYFNLVVNVPRKTIHSNLTIQKREARHCTQELTVNWTSFHNKSPVSAAIINCLFISFLNNVFHLLKTPVYFCGRLEQTVLFQTPTNKFVNIVLFTCIKI